MVNNITLDSRWAEYGLGVEVSVSRPKLGLRLFYLPRNASLHADVLNAPTPPRSSGYTYVWCHPIKMDDATKSLLTEHFSYTPLVRIRAPHAPLPRALPLNRNHVHDKAITADLLPVPR